MRTVSKLCVVVGVRMLETPDACDDFLSYEPNSLSIYSHYDPGFYKIIRKIMRKLSGEEKLHERNDLIESEHYNSTAVNGTKSQANGKKNA